MRPSHHGHIHPPSHFCGSNCPMNPERIEREDNAKWAKNERQGRMDAEAEVRRLRAQRDQYQAVVWWLTALDTDEDERRTVTLGQIIEEAKAAETRANAS